MAELTNKHRNTLPDEVFTGRARPADGILQNEKAPQLRGFYPTERRADARHRERTAHHPNQAPLLRPIQSVLPASDFV